MRKILIAGILVAIVVASIGLVTAGNGFDTGDGSGECDNFCNCDGICDSEEKGDCDDYEESNQKIDEFAKYVGWFHL